jgi:sterol desaturase/sphingolipid hydroxylase (fatty acid hydroxylase superfamily)
MKETMNQLIDMSCNVPILLLQSIAFNMYIYESLLSPGSHTFLQSLQAIILYSIFAEFNYYIYHRAAHSRYLYALVHKKHHIIINTYPFDTFYFTSIDDISLAACLEIPLLFVRLTHNELNLVLWFYITMGFLAHSNYVYDFHDLHHTLLKCNYCIVIPYFDILFGTFKTNMFTTYYQKIKN